MVIASFSGSVSMEAAVTSSSHVFLSRFGPSPSIVTSSSRNGGGFLDPISVSTARKHGSFSVRKIARQDQGWERHEAPDDYGSYSPEQGHNSDESGGFGAFASTFNSNLFSVPTECAADSRSSIPVLTSSNSRRRTMTARLTSLILSANSSGRISTRPASESILQTCCSSVSCSDRLTVPNLALFTTETRAPDQIVTLLYPVRCALPA